MLNPLNTVSGIRKWHMSSSPTSVVKEKNCPHSFKHHIFNLHMPCRLRIAMKLFFQLDGHTNRNQQLLTLMQLHHDASLPDMHTENVAGGGRQNVIFQTFRGASNISLLTFQTSRGGQEISPIKFRHDFYALTDVCISTDSCWKKL